MEKKAVSGVMLRLFLIVMLSVAFSPAPTEAEFKTVEVSSDYRENLAASGSGNSWFWVRDTITGAWGEALVGTGDAIYVARKSSFHRYRPADNSWAVLTVPPNPDAGDAFKTGTALAWDFGDYIYALYGAATGDSRRWFYRYSISGNSWQALANTSYDQGEGDAITWVGLDNSIYATIGGEQRATYFLRYDPPTNTWGDAEVADPPVGMGDGASLVWAGGEFLYALRGEFNEESPTYDFWRYNITSDIWATIADIPAYPHDVGVGGVGDGGSLLYIGLWLSNQSDLIYALSGNQAYPESPQPIPDNRFYRYTISTDSWERLADLPFGVGYYVGCRLGYANGHIYAWQGTPSTWTGGGDDLARYEFAPTEPAEAYISVPYHSQIKNYYCGPAALEMLFDFCGPDIPQLEIADVARTAPDGTYTSDMIRAAHFSNLSTSVGKQMPGNVTGYTARKLGYAAFEYWDMTIDELKSLIAAGYPIIVLTTWHYRVAVGYNSAHITFQDSYYGEMFNMTYEAFDVDWDYSNHWGLFVSPWNVEVSVPKNVSLGEVFNVTATITYPAPPPFPTDQYPASLSNTTVTLPNGLSLVLGETAKKTIGTGDLAAGASANVTWTVQAESLGNYTIWVETEGKVAGFVPPLPSYPESYNYEDRIGGFCQSVVAVISGLDEIPPTTFDDYDGLWHTTDFTITLNATDDMSGVAETYYKINDSPTKTVSVDGQPLITTEGANNKLEYWSVDNASNEESHRILTGIKLDKTAPTGSIMTNNDASYATSTSVTLTLTSSDVTSGVAQVKYSNDGVWDTEPWETPSPTKTWTLTPGDDTKAIYYQIKDNAGLVSITYSDIIILDTAPPSGSITIKDEATYATTTAVTLTLSAIDATSGVAEMHFSNDNTTYTEWQTYATSKLWTLQEGDEVKTVYVQFRDQAGLISTYLDTIVLDTSPPTILITSPITGYEIKSSTITVTWTGSDDTSGISHNEIKLDDHSWINVGTNTTHTFTGLNDGSHTIEVKATDNADLTKQDSVDFIVNTSPLLGLGYTEVAAILATIIATAGIVLYFFKIRKR